MRIMAAASLRFFVCSKGVSKANAEVQCELVAASSTRAEVQCAVRVVHMDTGVQRDANVISICDVAW